MKNKTKKVYAIILIILMLFSYLPPLKVEVNAVEYTAEINLVSTASKYDVGDTIQVKLVATNLGSHGKIIAGTGRISYDKTALKLTNIVPGDTSVYMQDTQGIANDRMNISRPNSSLSPTVSNGDVIAIFTFEALKDSTNSTTITFNADDGLEFTCENEDLTNYADEDDNFEMPTITLPIEVESQTHNITVKLTNEYGTPIEGAIFKVTSLDGTTQLLETDANGSLKIENQEMPEGAGPFVYNIEQKTTIDGYIKNTNPSTVTITFDSDGNVQSVVGANSTATNIGNDIEVLITNVAEEEEIEVEQEVFYMELTKVDEDNNIITSDTATFKIASPVAEDKTVTTTNGKTTKIEFTAPAEAGTYPYVIEETKVPSGYNQDPEDVILDLKFENINNVITLTSCTIVSYGKEATIDTSTGNKVIKMDIVNEKEDVSTEYIYTINIEKVKDDNLKTRITTDTAGFSVTYNEKSEYIKTNALGKATYKFSLNSNEIDTTKTYSFIIEEVKAPEGYLLDSTQQIVNITLNEDGTINTMNVEGTKIIKLNATSNDANVQIINEEEPTPIVLTPETFNLVLNKQDNNGNLITADSATFNLISPDGTKTTYNTTNGVTQNISLTAPNAAGKQVYFLQETKAPAGYEKLTRKYCN